MTSKQHLFLVVLSLAAVHHAFAGDDDVIDLTSNTVDSFKSAIAENDAMLVEFFAPWCGHCKRLAPEYAKAATSLKSADPPVPLAKVDCTSEAGGKDICGEYGVSGYPTLKIFKGGEFAQEYQGPRDADGIVKYMKSQVGPASKEYQTFGDFSNRIKDAKDTLIVGVFKSDSDDLYKKFSKAADKLRESVDFIHIFAQSAKGDISSVVGVPPLSPPQILLVRPSSLANKFEPNHIVYEESSDLPSWVRENYHGIVGVRTQANIDDFRNPLVIVFYDVDYTRNPKGTNYWRNRVLKVAKNFHPKVNFAISNSDTFAGEIEEFGLKAPIGKDATPVVGARGSDGKKYVLNEKFSLEALQTFVENFVDDKLEPHVKSEELPESNDGPVKVAVGKNFDELVTNSDKDVLIEFYAPWCGHCKKLAPTWEELGDTLKDEDSLTIAKLDATANDVPAQFVVHGFPTIYFYPADTKTPKKYEGGRDVQDFIKFLAKHSSKELKGYNRDGSKKSRDEL